MDDSCSGDNSQRVTINSHTIVMSRTDVTRPQRWTASDLQVMMGDSPDCMSRAAWSFGGQ